jgi:hypothetical protein
MQDLDLCRSEMLRSMQVRKMLKKDQNLLSISSASSQKYLCRSERSMQVRKNVKVSIFMQDLDLCRTHMMVMQ